MESALPGALAQTQKSLGRSHTYRHFWIPPPWQKDVFLEKKRSLFWGQAEEENERIQQTDSQTSRGDVCRTPVCHF